MILPQVAGAGLLAGDKTDQRIRVGPQASLDLASAGATLVHGNPDGPEAISRWTYEIAEGAHVVAAIAPNALLENAQLAQLNLITIHPAATFVIVDGFVDASSDQSVSWSSTTIVRRPTGENLMTDRQVATGSQLARHHRFRGRWSAFGSMIILAPAEECDGVLKRVQESELHTDPADWVGVAALRSHSGVGIRYAAKNGASLRKAINRTISCLRSTLRHKVSHDVYWGPARIQAGSKPTVPE